MTRAILSLLTGVWGGATMLALSQGPGPDAAVILAAALAASLAGAVTGPLLQRAHWVWALVTPVLVTTLGAALAGAYVGFPHDIPLGLAFGPAMVWASIAQSPVVAVVWLLGAVTLRRVAYSLK